MCTALASDEHSAFAVHATLDMHTFTEQRILNPRGRFCFHLLYISYSKL